mgnify:CR=1 FL=1
MITSRELLIYLSLLYKGDRSKIMNMLRGKIDIDYDEVPRLLKTIKANVTTIVDDDFPAILKESPFPPLVIYYYGDLSLLTNYSNNISVIGSRKCEQFEEQEARDIIDELGDKVTIVSGLAIGIDSISQREALRIGAKVIGVLGFGIDYCYPPESYDLYLAIKEKGLLISEYPNDLAPEPEYFLMRNRLIAYSSRATVVIAAKERSGTLSTVSHALYANRDVMALPARKDDRSACNQLIREGAELVTSGHDILISLGLEK